MLKVQRCVGVATAVLGLMGAAMGCGDSEDPPSFGSIAKGLESPTGTVDENTAGEIREKYEAANQNSVGFGVRDDQVGQSSTGTFEQSCPAGGKMKATASGSESSGTVKMSYDNCCYTEGCCASGRGNMYYNTDGGAGSSAAGYNFCASFDMDYSCEGTSASLDYSGCFGLDGSSVLLIEVNGKSFAVSSSKTGGSGSLEIRGANGTWTCTYDGGGSCTSSSGGSFTFSSSD